MTAWILPLAVGTATGILSACGVGGWTLLLVYLTSFAGVEQSLAQGINLLYFLPAAALALPSHVKNGYVDKRCLLTAVGAGLAAAVLGAVLATGLEEGILRRLFGLFLAAVGLRELFSPSGGGSDSPPE